MDKNSEVGSWIMPCDLRVKSWGVPIPKNELVNVSMAQSGWCSWAECWRSHFLIRQTFLGAC